MECASNSSYAVKDNAGKLTVKEVNGNIVQADYRAWLIRENLFKFEENVIEHYNITK